MAKIPGIDSTYISAEVIGRVSDRTKLVIADDVISYKRKSSFRDQYQSMIDVYNTLEALGGDAVKSIVKNGRKAFVKAAQEMMGVSQMINDELTSSVRKKDAKAFMAHFNKVKVEAAPSIASTEPLQSAFRAVLLDVYMPIQSRLLGQLALELRFCKAGINITNELADHMTSFNMATVLYSFYDFVNQYGETNTYENLYETAVTKLRDEQIQINRDEENLLKLIDRCNTIRLEIEDLDIGSEQKIILHDMVQGYKDRAEFVLVYIQDIKELMSKLSIMRMVSVSLLGDAPGPYAFAVGNRDDPDWKAKLAKLERDIIDGVFQEDGSIKGGLPVLLSDCLSDQRRFSELGQSQQIGLQFEFTAIYQEWSIVSKVITLLNQMYRKLGGEITG